MDYRIEGWQYRALTDEWLQTYNEEWPHDSLGRVPPLNVMPRPNRWSLVIECLSDYRESYLA